MNIIIIIRYGSIIMPNIIIRFGNIIIMPNIIIIRYGLGYGTMRVTILGNGTLWLPLSLIYFHLATI